MKNIRRITWGIIMSGIFWYAFLHSGGISQAEEKDTVKQSESTTNSVTKNKPEISALVYGLNNISSLKYHLKLEHYQFDRDGKDIIESNRGSSINPIPNVPLVGTPNVPPVGAPTVPPTNVMPIAPGNGEPMISPPSIPRRRFPRGWRRPGGGRCDPSIIEMDINLEVIKKCSVSEWHLLKATYHIQKITFWDDNLGFKYDLSKSKDYKTALKELSSAVCLKESDQEKAFNRGDNSFAARALNFKELLKSLAYAALNGYSFTFELKPDGNEIELVDMDKSLEGALSGLPKNASNFTLLKQMIKADALKNIQSLFPPVKSGKYRDAKPENHFLKYNKVDKQKENNRKDDKSKIVSSKERVESENFTYCPRQQLICERRNLVDTYSREISNLNWTDSKEWRKYWVKLVEVKNK